MPILNVKVSARKSAALTRSISAILLDLTARILNKKPEVTSWEDARWLRTAKAVSISI
jgi:4-oxalocrotonate tautomerase